MSLLETIVDLSPDGRTAILAATALCWERQSSLVDADLLARALGWSDDRLAAAVGACGPLLFHIDTELRCEPAADLLRVSLGPAGRPKPGVWERLRRQVFREHGRLCAYCHSPDRVQVDHVRPLRLGGSNHFENLLPACRDCNTKKGGSSEVNWMARLWGAKS